MRVVLDSVILVRALINPHSIWGRVVFELYEHYHLVTSLPLLTETLEVIQRPALQRKYRSVETRDMAFILDRFSQAELVQIEDIPPVSRDPDDDHVLETARVGLADVIVTQDNDLLTLGAHGSCKILTAADFIALLHEARDA
jgi:putative PIN family toxin of toxin-antitoxin system